MSTITFPQTITVGPVIIDGQRREIGLTPWTLDEAERRTQLVAANDEHLRPWFPWMTAEPLPLEKSQEVLLGWETEMAAGITGQYAIRLDNAIFGAIALMTRPGPGTMEIGYWLDHTMWGHGVVTRSALALARVAFEIDGIQRVEIHHDPRNFASGGVAKKAGFECQADWSFDWAPPVDGSETIDDVAWHLVKPA